MEPRIADASPSDAPVVTRLLSAQLAEHRIPLEADRLASAIEGALRGDGRAIVLLAWQGTTPVAVAYLASTWTLEHGGAVLWLEELYVIPERRGQGIGSRLLQAVISRAWSSGTEAIDLEIETSHGRAANLYARAGFQRLDRARWSLRTGLPVR